MMNYFFEALNRRGLNPNQYYLLYCISKGIDPKNINVHLEIRTLKSKNLIDKEHTITEKGISFILDMNELLTFDKPKLKPEETLSYYARYIALFPGIKLPSGKYARTTEKNVEQAFNWFFKNYSYSWDLIFKATQRYVEEYEVKNYLFMRTCLFFIKKSDVHKNITSDLADYCMIVESPDQYEDPKTHFKDKVV